jgi:hypothetical protein
VPETPIKINKVSVFGGFSMNTVAPAE